MLVATLTTEKQAERVGGVLEGVGIMRKSSLPDRDVAMLTLKRGKTG